MNLKKEDNFVDFLVITSNILMEYENEMRKNTQHLSPIPPGMQNAIQLLSLLNTSKTSLSLHEKNEMEAIFQVCQRK